MIEFENRSETQRSISEVFMFLADLENLPKWNYLVMQVRNITEGPPRVAPSIVNLEKQTVNI